MLLAEGTDLLLHGHQHTVLANALSDPDRRMQILAAGSLFEGDEGDTWPNGFQIVDIFLSEAGSILRYRVSF